MKTIKTEQELCAVIGEEIPGLSEKVEERLNDFAADFGKMYARRKNAPAETAAAVDQAIERDYRENL